MLVVDPLEGAKKIVGVVAKANGHKNPSLIQIVFPNGTYQLGYLTEEGLPVPLAFTRGAECLGIRSVMYEEFIGMVAKRAEQSGTNP